MVSLCVSVCVGRVFGWVGPWLCMNVHGVGFGFGMAWAPNFPIHLVVGSSTWKVEVF